MRPAQGGIRRHVDTLCRHLGALGVQCTVAAPPGSGAFGSPILHAPIRARFSLADLQAARIIARPARSVHLLHGHGLRGAWIAYLASRISRTPFVLTLHNMAPPNLPFPARWALANVLGHARAVVAVSAAVANSLEAAGCHAIHPIVIPNGIDLAEFDVPPEDLERFRRQMDLPPQAPVVAAAGRFSPEKGFHVLLQAVPIVHKAHPAVRFLLAGTGPQEQRLRRTAPPGVVFAGYLPCTAPLFLCSDAVAVPSLTEGQGLAALEAMAARRPVAASSVGGLAETVIHARTGLLVPAGDAPALARAIVSLLDNEDLRRLMGEAGRARVEALYSADLMASRTLDLYRQVLNRDGAG